jgi:hypothetical protein
MLRRIHDNNQVKTMVMDYMKQTRTVIVAVIPANIDFHNVEIVQMASSTIQMVRAIGVVTKPDLVDRSAEQGMCWREEEERELVRWMASKALFGIFCLPGG